MIGVIGNRGLVGSALCVYFEKEGIKYKGINTKNYKQCVGSSFDYLINADGRGVKHLADTNPKEDFEKNVKSTSDFIFDFTYKTFIHISSIDVYSNPSSKKDASEDVMIDVKKLSPYGFHKYLSEIMVRQYCPQWLILRLGGLVGPKLKKNPVFDWSHGRPFFIRAQSCLTFIHTQTIAQIILNLIEKRVVNEVFNVCASDSICLEKLNEICDFKTKEVDAAELALQNYNINVTRLKNFFPVKTSREYIRQYLLEDLK